jgi:hypothetical protein
MVTIGVAVEQLISTGSMTLCGMKAGLIPTKEPVPEAAPRLALEYSV